MNNIYNPYQQVMPSLRQNVLPPQQILQANGKSSIDMIQMSPNSSVLIADATAPIVWRCVSDGLGNVTAEPFDIIPHKDEVQVQQESLEQRISRLEAIISEQSTFTRNGESEFKTDVTGGKGRKKSTGNAKSDDGE